MEKQAVFGIVLTNDRNEILLIKRRDIPVWVIPGGGLDQGESPEEAVIREVLEETGYKVAITRKVAEYLPVNKFTQFSHVYECQILSGTSSTGFETKDIAFFPIKNLPKLLPPPYPGWIKEAYDNLPSLIRKKVEGVSYFVFIKLLISHPLLVLRYLLMRLGLHYNR